MDKLFTLNKLFFCFCAALILSWAALQLVSMLRLSAIAELDGERILAWSWPEKKIKSKIEILGTKIVSRTNTDAIVKVSARQTLQSCETVDESYKDVGKSNDCQVVLAYYRTNRNWFLGKVEMQ